jgi:hypothetical protein
MKLMYRLKGDTRGMHAWACTATPEEAEVIFRGRLAHYLSRPPNFLFHHPDMKKDIARRISTRDFEVEVDPNYFPGTSIWGNRGLQSRRTENKE